MTLLAASATPALAGRRAAVTGHPGVTERLLIIGVILINQFGTPASWFTENTGAASGPEQDFLLSYGSLALIGLLGLGLLGNGDAVVRALSAEPLMLLYFFGIGLSPLWSSRFGESLASVINIAALIGLALILLVRYTPVEIFQLITAAFTIGILLDLAWIVALGPLGRSVDGWDGLATQKNALGTHGLVGILVFLIAARTMRKLRLPFYLLAILSLVLLFGSQSKTSLGAGLVTAASFVVFLAFRARRTLIGAVIITLVTSSIVTLLLVTANLEEIAGWFGKDTTFTGRTPLWREVLDAIGRRPLLGYGYDGYFGGPLSESHRISAFREFDWGPTHSHNALMQSALHVGIPLTIVYIVFNLRGLMRAADHVRWVRGPIGLFPLVYLTMITITSITESGIFTQRFGITLFIIAIVQARIGVEDARDAGALRLDHEREVHRTPRATVGPDLQSGLALGREAPAGYEKSET